MHKITKCKFNIVGSAFGQGAQIYNTSKAPKYLQTSYNLVEKLGSNFRWDSIIENTEAAEEFNTHGRNYHAVLAHDTTLADAVSRLVQIENELCIVIGGDHSCGIGTWSGAVHAMHAEDHFGLIWIDAHMDSHTYATSPSKALHGMPLAILMDKGDAKLRHIESYGRKIKPEYLVLIGVRSFEDGEHDLLKSNKVRVFYMDEVIERGIQSVFAEALSIVTNGTIGFGISIDLDAFDPVDAPGVGSPAPGGLRFHEVGDYLPTLFSSEHLKCLEIAEFNPELDHKDKTADIVYKILRILDRTKNKVTPSS